MKKIDNANLFLAGNSTSSFPTIAFITYDVKSGNASKTNCVHEIPDPDPSKILSEMWAEEIQTIKTNEGIE